MPQLTAIIRRVRPEIVVTFEPNGGYGHPDHIAIHKHTVAAFHAAADPDCCPEQGPAWQAARRFYTAIPRSFFCRMAEEMKALGADESETARLEEEGGRAWPDEEVTAVIDVSGTVEAKWSALALPPDAVRPGRPVWRAARSNREGLDEPRVVRAGVAGAAGCSAG